MLKMQAIGNLGRDCTVNTVNGKNVINFNLCHTEKYKDKDGNQMEKSTWVEASYWTERTAIAPYLTKGQKVYVDGTPELRTFEKKDGTTGTSLSLRVSHIELLGSKPANVASTEPNAAFNKMMDEPTEDAF